MTEIEQDTIKAVAVACRTVMCVDVDMPVEIQTALLKLAARELPAQEAPSPVGTAEMMEVQRWQTTQRASAPRRLIRR